MERDERLRKLIERIVREEIENITSETKDVIKEAVRKSLLPQLREAVRDSISGAMEEMLVEELSPQEVDIEEKLIPGSEGPEAPPAEVAAEEVEVGGGEDGRYVYCVANSGVSVSLGKIGIEDEEVYTIPYKGLCAVVHNCPTEPYQSDDEQVVKGWVKKHQEVLDVAMEKFGTVLPLGFDTIIKSEDETDPKQVVKNWLKDEFENLKGKIDKVSGKQEYGIQIFYDSKTMGEIISRESEEIQKLKEEMKSQKPGMAYMYKQKIEKAVKEEMEGRVESYFNDFYGAIKKYVDDIKVEKNKRADEDKVMFMNLSCLVPKEKVEELGEELERIENTEGILVRFTGPWPPYSFV